MPNRLLIALLVFGINILNAQTNWTTKNLFEQKNFIENKGQNDFDTLPNHEAILFSANIDGVNYYFTKSGYTISHSEKQELSEEEKDKMEASQKGKKEEEDLFKYKIVKKYHELKWVNANPQLVVISENKVDNYYSYPDFKNPDKKQSIIAYAFKKIIYKNIYPNTDILFEFPKDSIGIKYSICLYPGADVEKIKMIFPDGKVGLNKTNDLEITSEFGKIIDHKPTSFFVDSKTRIKSNFKINKNQIGFEIENYLKDKTVIIDPWTVTPAFGTSDNAYDIDYDNQGNVYAYGGLGTSTIGHAGPFVLLKYNPGGSLIWSYFSFVGSSYGFYGDFAIDKSSNSIYLVGGQGYVEKINSNAVLLATFPGNSYFGEMFRVLYSKCINKLVIAGGGLAENNYQTCLLDTNLLNFSPVRFVPTINGSHDVGLLALDNFGNCYEGTNIASILDGIFSNKLVKLPLPALFPVTYSVSTNYAMTEMNTNVYYGLNPDYYSIGYNGLTTSNTFLYSFDSYVLKKWDGPTGNLLTYKRIHYPASGDSSKIYWGGITADDCGNLFLADSNIVRQYDTNLTLINSYVMPGVIIDVNLSNNGILNVCGLGFVSSFTPAGAISCNNIQPLVVTSSNTNGTCNFLGSATVSITGGIPPYNIVWNTSPVQNGPTINNVPPGSYIVTIEDAALCPPHKSIDTITISGPSPLHINASIVNTCYGGTTGSITAIVSGGTSGAPYQYNWMGFPGNNANILTNLAAGSYKLIVTSGTCIDSISVIVAFTPPIIKNIIATFCHSDDNYTLPNGTIVNVAGVYYDTLTNTRGCDSIVVTTLTFNPVATLEVSICYGQNFTLPSGIIVSTAGVYNDTLNTIFGCDSIIETKVIVTPPSVIATDVNIICGQNYTLPSGVITNVAGIYKDTITAAYGCKMIVVTTLTVNSIPTKSVNAIFSCGQSYTLPSGKIVNSPGVYNDLFSTSKGCDSIITTFLTNDISSLDLKTLIPNAFSPNEDGLNDQLCIPANQCIEKITLMIYDRWGEKVYEGNSLDDCWDGTYKGNKLESAVFAYYFTVEFADGTSAKGKGNISLIK